MIAVCIEWINQFIQDMLKGKRIFESSDHQIIKSVLKYHVKTQQLICRSIKNDLNV